MTRRKYLSWALLVFLAVLFSLYFQKTFYEIPILMYHHVGYSTGDSGLYVTPETFERQLEFLKVHRYRVMPLSELIRLIKTRQSIPYKSVLITFDDGNLDNFKNAFPMLKKKNFPATIFMISSNVNHDGWLSEENLRILDGSSVTIGSHTAHHTFLPSASQAIVKNELADSKKELERILLHPVLFFSYPAGGVTSNVEALVKETGYEGAVTTNYGKGRHDPHKLHRIKIGNTSGNLFNFWLKVSGYYSLGKKRVQYDGQTMSLEDSL